MEQLGVIARQDEPTDWVHSLVTVRKPNKIRLCIDPKDLNRAIKREHYHIKTVDEVIENLPQAPQSNGQAERCVQTVKNLLRKADESGGNIYTSLMNYRASPIDGIGLSPSQLLMNRQLRTKLPITADLLNSKAVESCKPQLIARQEKQKYYYDRHSATLPNVNKGEIVRVQKDSKQWEPAIVDQKLADRSYVVRTGDNKLYRRNRRQLLKTRETTLPSDVSDHSEAMYDAPPQSHSEPDPPNTTPAKPNLHENAATPHREPRPQRTLRRPKHLEDFICK